MLFRSWIQRLRFLGAFAAPALLAIGVLALMPPLDHPGPQQSESSTWISLHAALVLLGYGAFGLSALAALMYLVQEHNLRFHKGMAVAAFMPPIQRLEGVTRKSITMGILLLTLGLGTGALYLKSVRGTYVTGDAFVLYCWFTWVVYLGILTAASRFSQRGRRLAWSALGGFIFIILTFWGVWMFSGLHNPARDLASRAAWRIERTAGARIPGFHPNL